ncbi:MAG: acyl carrier protein [Bacteroidales bacterium]|nr:acyl carrier protein [Bacteroidales bacterium]
MQRQEIKDIVNDFLVDEFEIELDQIKEDATLKDELEIESLDLVDIIVMIEKKFGFKIKPEEIVKVQTVQDLYIFIEERVKS